MLGALDAVRECVVVLREDAPGDKRIVAYVVPSEAASSNGDRPQSAELRSLASRTLPDYMVPAHFVMLEALPLSPNGKVDRAALPSPDPYDEVEGPYEAASTDLERTVAELWKQVLGVEHIGVRDNFFRLGGHSLGASVLMTRLADELELELPLRLLFANPSVRALSEAVEEARRDADATRAIRARVSKRHYGSTFDSSLIPMQPNGTRKPLFLVSGAHANETDFLRFVGNLLPYMQDQPIYGFKARGLDGRERPHETVLEMAADYVAEMRQFQPEGPYLLAGNCVGGIVAFEMAQELHRLGEEAALVALLDATRPSEDYAQLVESHFRYFKRDRLMRHLGELQQRSAGGKLAYLLGKAVKKVVTTLSFLQEGARGAARAQDRAPLLHRDRRARPASVQRAAHAHHQRGDVRAQPRRGLVGPRGRRARHARRPGRPRDAPDRAHPESMAEDLRASIDEALTTWPPYAP